MKDKNNLLLNIYSFTDSKNEIRAYIQKIYVGNGANIKILTSGVNQACTSKFTKQPISTFWNSAKNDSYTISNLCFFDLGSNPSAIPFPVKANSILLTSGNGGHPTYDIPNPKKLFYVYNNKAGIVDLAINDYKYYTCSYMTTLLKNYESTPPYKNTNSLAVAGFATSVDKTSGSEIGRTLIGVSDDGINAYILNAKNLKTADAVAILVNSFSVNANKIVQFDGSASSQYMDYKNRILEGVDGDKQKVRSIPVCIAVGK